MRDLDFVSDGAALHGSAALSLLGELEAVLAGVPAERAGTRLHNNRALADRIGGGPIHAIAAAQLGPNARPVRAILFDKTPATNWALGWHQDRTIVVRERHAAPGYGRWTIKAGLQHVEPPFAVIGSMVTLRIHLDDVPSDNAPLMIAPGSHRLGRIGEPAIEAVVAEHGIVNCLARRGDVWSYATPILHASASARGSAHRRVIQVDYTAIDLPPPLEWRGI